MILPNKNAIIIYRGASKMKINIDDFDKTSDGRILVPEDEYYQEAYIEKQREIAKQIELGKLKSYTLEEAQQILEDGHF